MAAAARLRQRLGRTPAVAAAVLRLASASGTPLAGGWARALSAAQQGALQCATGALSRPRQSRSSAGFASDLRQRRKEGALRAAGRYCVLRTGASNAYVRSEYGEYPDLFERLLAEPGETWERFDCVVGELPDADRSLGEYDGFVITGSRHDAHGDERWLEDLRAYVRHLVKNRKRVLGICFGHQLVANALGGASGRSEVGMQMGLREVMPTDAMRRAWYASGLLDAPGSTYHVHQLHQDQVLRLPESATLLASTPHTPVEAFAVGEQVLCLQGHPEFGPDNDIIESFVQERVVEQRAFPMKVADTARESMRGGAVASHALLRAMLRRFLKGRPAD